MSDVQRRALERAASQGDREAEIRLNLLRNRFGECGFCGGAWTKFESPTSFRTLASGIPVELIPRCSTIIRSSNVIHVCFACAALFNLQAFEETKPPEHALRGRVSTQTWRGMDLWIITEQVYDFPLIVVSQFGEHRWRGADRLGRFFSGDWTYVHSATLMKLLKLRPRRQDSQDIQELIARQTDWLRRNGP